MLGRTHIAAGVTAAMLVLQPDSTLAVGSAIAGGALGGMICDIDCKGTERHKDALSSSVIALLCIAAVVLFDIRTGNGLTSYIMKSLGAGVLIGFVGFLACCIGGCMSHHRTFTHSVTGLLAMSISLWLICPPFACAFAIGMISHILLDLLNRRSIPLLFPLKKPSVCLNLCSADGKINYLLELAFTAAAWLLILHFASMVYLKHDLLLQLWKSLCTLFRS